ncbi:MAG: DUF1641 domain-containing protein [Bacteroidota bacterium]
MEENKLQVQINELNSKLDIILEEIELQRRHRREMEDLKDDLMRVGKDFYDTAVEELDQVHDHVNTKDILHFGKYMLRNVNTISKTIQQLESIKDFLKDASPLMREYIIDLMAALDEFDRKGYFEFFKESKNIADKIVTSFSKNDVQHLGDNIVTILNTVKNLTQPEMLHAVNNAVSVYKNLDVEVPKEVSYLKLLKELNTPEVKRGITFAIHFLKNISSQNENKQVNKSQNN